MSKLVAIALVLCALSCGREQTPADAAPQIADAPGPAVVDASPVVVDAGPDARPLGLACAALGGTCVPGRWASCPDGTEPTPDVHSDCLPSTAVRGYFCCVPAKPTACQSDHGGNCFVDECPGCWGPASEPTSCQPERVCCNYVCLD